MPQDYRGEQLGGDGSGNEAAAGLLQLQLWCWDGSRRRFVRECGCAPTALHIWTDHYSHALNAISQKPPTKSLFFRHSLNLRRNCSSLSQIIKKVHLVLFRHTILLNSLETAHILFYVLGKTYSQERLVPS